MRQTVFGAGLGLAIGTMLTVAPAFAQASRTYVSGHGLDTNNCSLAAPCRSFQVAHDATTAGGEITVLDPAGYGALAISKAISIVNDGVGEAGVSAASGANGITVNAGVADIINLRGLTLVGMGLGGGDGIIFATGGGMNIQNCVIRGFTGSGIYAHPNTAANFNISDTIISNNGNVGIDIAPSGIAAVTATFKRVQVIGNNTGLAWIGPAAGSGFNATVEDSLASNNVNYGIEVLSQGAPTILAVVNSQAVNNGTGLLTDGAAATMLIAGNVVSGNAAAFSTLFGGGINSFGNNYVKGNTSDGGTIPTVGLK